LTAEDDGAVSVSEVVGGFSGSGQLELNGVVITPNDHERDVVRRWREADATFSVVEQPLGQPVDSAILAAQRFLTVVLADIWSLNEAAQRAGIDKNVVKAAIQASRETLALAHDLGNYVKHGPLTWDGLTDGRPTLGPPQAKTGSVGTSTTFSQSAFLEGDEFSAVDVARQALGEWESLLRGWALLS
jgi:hypothetical protein